MLHNYAAKFGQTPLGSAMFKIFEGGLSFFSWSEPLDSFNLRSNVLRIVHTWHAVIRYL